MDYIGMYTCQCDLGWSGELAVDDLFCMIMHPQLQQILAEVDFQTSFQCCCICCMVQLSAEEIELFKSLCLAHISISFSICIIRSLRNCTFT